MTYTPLTPAEADPDSPLTTTLMTKIKDNLDFLKSKADGIPAAAWSGLKPALGIDTAHDVTVASGAARDTTDAATLILAAAWTKRLDVRWSGGSPGGGLANAPLINLNPTVSFDNATSKIRGIGLFGGAATGDTIIVEGSAANSGIHEVTAATADDATLSVAPITEAAGVAITVYIVKANWRYNIFIADDGVGGAEIGFDDSLTATNFLTQAGVGTLYRGVGYIETDAGANISALAWVGDRVRYIWLFASGTVNLDFTYFKPAMLHSIDQLRGVSGGGGGETSTATRAGRAGGGGAYGLKTAIPAADLAVTEAGRVGRGGARGASSSGADGQPGGATFFGSLLTLTGGSGGTTPTSAVTVGTSTGHDYAAFNNVAPAGTRDNYGNGGRGGPSTTSISLGADGHPGYLLIKERFA